MTTKKPFWQTTAGIVIGCLGLVVVLLLCACIGVFAFGLSSFNNLFGELTPVAQATATAPRGQITTTPPTVVPVGQNPVTDMVMSKDVAGDTLDPVDVTYAFPANQSIFHAVVTVKDAPANTSVGAIWYTDQGQRMGDYELKTQGSRNLDFTFKPDGGKLPPGNYRVEVRVNGTPYRSMNFSVTTQGASSAAPSSSASRSSSAASSIAPKPSGLVASVTMATGTQGDNKDPVGATNVFAPNATFHAVVATKNAPANTKYGAVWYATDVGSAASPNTLIDQTELATDGTRNIDFTLSPTSSWPPGTYRVEIYVNGTLDTVKIFTVSTSGASSAPSASSAASSKPQPSSSAPAVLTECGTIPTGQGGLLVINYYGQQLNYTVGGTLYKIDANQRKAIFLAPGKQNYSANIPGVGEKQGSLDIVAGQCLTQSWAN